MIHRKKLNWLKIIYLFFKSIGCDIMHHIALLHHINNDVRPSMVFFFPFFFTCLSVILFWIILSSSFFFFASFTCLFDFVIWLHSFFRQRRDNFTIQYTLVLNLFTRWRHDHLLLSRERHPESVKP